MQKSETEPTWSARYGARHRWIRITEFPNGVRPLGSVRLYSRAEHYLLQWWDRRERKNRTERIDGDLIAAVGRGREIEQRLDEFGAYSPRSGARTFGEVIDGYLSYQEHRVEAGEIDLCTVRRYRAALRYLTRFVELTEIRRGYPLPGRINSEFVLRFQAYLKTLVTTSNGHPNAMGRPLQGVSYIVATSCSAFSWASDPDRGGLLPTEFRNPFLRANKRLRKLAPDLSCELGVNVSMVVDFLRCCDVWQLRLFGTLILFGLRAAEPCWVFTEELTDQWFHVRCHPELEYFTKGQRDKKFPLLVELQPFWNLLLNRHTAGLLFQGRATSRELPIREPGEERLAGMTERYSQGCRHVKSPTAMVRQQIRANILQEAGALKYDTIEGEFRNLAERLRWPRNITLKDFRHFFATSLENAGCPEAYRRYFMGHSPGKAAIVRYTHLTDLERQYRRLIDGDWQPIVAALLDRVHDLSNGSREPP